MKHKSLIPLILSLSLSFTLSCISVGKSPVKHDFSFTRKIYTDDKDALYSAIIEFLKGKGFEIIYDGGLPGRIITDWNEADLAYYYGTFKRESITEYCDCGKPDINWTYERKRSKVVIATEQRDGYFLAMIIASFNTYANYSPCIAVAIRDSQEKMSLLKQCESTGVLEKEFLDLLEIKFSKGAYNG